MILAGIIVAVLAGLPALVLYRRIRPTSLFPNYCDWIVPWNGTAVLAAAGPLTAAPDFLGPWDEIQEALLPVSAGASEWAERIVRLFEAPAIRTYLVEQAQSQLAELSWTTSIAPRVEALYYMVANGDAIPRQL